MHEFKTFSLTEWRLLIRGRYIWMMMGVVAILAILIHQNHNDLMYVDEYVAGFVALLTAPVSIMAVLYGVFVAARDDNNDANTLLQSLPVHSGKQWLTKFMVSAIPFTLLALVPLGIYTIHSFFLSLTPDPHVIIMLGANIFVMLYSLAVGMFVRFLARGMISYVIASAVWIAHFLSNFMFNGEYSSAFGYLAAFLPWELEGTG